MNNSTGIDASRDIEHGVKCAEGRALIAIVVLRDESEWKSAAHIVVKSLKGRRRPRLDLLEQGGDVRSVRDEERELTRAMHSPLDSVEIARLRIDRRRRTGAAHRSLMGERRTVQIDDGGLRRLRRAEQRRAKQREREEECFSASPAGRR